MFPWCPQVIGTDINSDLADGDGLTPVSTPFYRAPFDCSDVFWLWQARCGWHFKRILVEIQKQNSSSNPFLGSIGGGRCDGELCCTHQKLPRGLFHVWFFIQTVAYARVCILGNVWCVNFIFPQCLYKLVWFISHLLHFHTLPTLDTSAAAYFCASNDHRR